MNQRIVTAALAATVLAGAATVLVPQHLASIARVAAVAVVVVAGGLVLGAVGPLVAAEPPSTALDAAPTGAASPLDPHGLRDARRDLDRPAAPGALPPPVRDRLVTAAAMRLARAGLDPALVRTSAVPVAGLGSGTWRVLTTPPAPGSARDPVAAARAVHRVLDELATIDRPAGAAHGHR